MQSRFTTTTDCHLTLLYGAQQVAAGQLLPTHPNTYTSLS